MNQRKMQSPSYLICKVLRAERKCIPRTFRFLHHQTEYISIYTSIENQTISKQSRVLRAFKSVIVPVSMLGENLTCALARRRSKSVSRLLDPGNTHPFVGGHALSVYPGIDRVASPGRTGTYVYNSLNVSRQLITGISYAAPARGDHSRLRHCDSARLCASQKLFFLNRSTRNHSLP